MSRCQHCKKLTHSEDLIVEYDSIDHDKVYELLNLEGWTSKYEYQDPDDPMFKDKSIYGKLKCGDIYIHFKMRKND